MRRLQENVFHLISMLVAKFNIRNIQYILKFKFFVFFELEQKLAFCKSLILAMLFALVYPCLAVSTEFNNTTIINEKTNYLFKEIKEGFDWNFRILLFQTLQEPSVSSQNPNNHFLKINKSNTVLNVRPDLFFSFEKFEFNLKPRFDIEYRFDNANGINSDANEVKDDLYINEWLGRFFLTEKVFISNGRENLQWGPSYLISPSNPFFKDNGKDSNVTENRGMDFFRVIFMSDIEWTVSLIACYDKGEAEFINYDFENIYALKIDYSGSDRYGSVIFSYKEHDRFKTGFFGGLTMSESMLIYGEGFISKGIDALYPDKEDFKPLDYSMKSLKDENNSLSGTILLGTSYTTTIGPTFSLEYVYNNYGYDDNEASAYYELRDQASNLFVNNTTLKGLGASALQDTFYNGLSLLRQNYFMFQYLHNDIRDILNIMSRVTYNIDDRSMQFYNTIDFYVGDHMQCFSSILLNNGKMDSEYGTTLDYQWITGLRYIF